MLMVGNARIFMYISGFVFICVCVFVVVFEFTNAAVSGFMPLLLHAN